MSGCIFPEPRRAFTRGSRFQSLGCRQLRRGFLIGMLLVGLVPPAVVHAQRRREPERPRRPTPADEQERDFLPPQRSGSRADTRVEPVEGTRSRYADGPLAKLVAYAEQSRDALAEVTDYTCVFSKKEVVSRRLIQQKMEMKYRHKPFSVYFRYIAGDEAGREVIYVDGGNNNRLVVHETGIKAIAGTMYLPLNDSRVVQENRHPITSVGIHNLLKKAFETFELDASDDLVEVKMYPKAKLDDLPCVAFVIRHPEPKKGLPFHETRLYFDRETRLPIHVERYDWPRREGDKLPLLEEYSYRNVKLNVGLKGADFDPRNPRYAFPR